MYQGRTAILVRREECKKTKLNNKQLLDEVFVISRIIKVEVRVINLLCSASADNPYLDLDYSG